MVWYVRGFDTCFSWFIKYAYLCSSNPDSNSNQLSLTQTTSAEHAYDVMESSLCFYMHHLLFQVNFQSISKAEKSTPGMHTLPSLTIFCSTVFPFWTEISLPFERKRYNYNTWVPTISLVQQGITRLGLHQRVSVVTTFIIYMFCYLIISCPVFSQSSTLQCRN